MRTKLTKWFRYGFVLTEADLARIVDIAEDQLKKLPDEPQVVTTFHLTYKDGVITTSSSLKEVTAQPNHGSSQIVGLQITCAVNNAAEPNNISIQFQDIQYSRELGKESVQFDVQGKARDWTVATSSFLEERIEKIKRICLDCYFGHSKSDRINKYLIASVLGMACCGAIFMYREVYPPEIDIPDTPSSIVTIDSNYFENELRAKGIKDPIEALILREKLFKEKSMELDNEWREYNEQMQKATLAPNNKRIQLNIYLLLFSTIPPVFLYLVRTFLHSYHPTFNFCWGDYVEVFRKKESVRKFVFVVIIIGFIISLLSEWLASSISNW